MDDVNNCPSFPTLTHSLRIVSLNCTTFSLLNCRALDGVKGSRNDIVNYMAAFELADYDASMVNREEIISIVKETGYDQFRWLRDP